MVRPIEDHEGEPCSECGRIRTGWLYMKGRGICRRCHSAISNAKRALEPKRTMLTPEQLEARIAIAEAEKRHTKGEILKDGLFGPDDKHTRAVNSPEHRKANPQLKVDRAYNPSETIHGRPRTGRRI